MRRALIKLNDSFSGEGNALVRFPETHRARARCGARCDQRRDAGADRDARRATSRSCSGWAASSRSSSRPTRSTRRARSSGPARAARCCEVSTHDQILGGDSGQIYLGCSFPAHEELPPGDPRRRARASGTCWRAMAWSAAMAWTSSHRGTRPTSRGTLTALEINLRVRRDDAPVPGAAVPHRRRARSGDAASSCR